MDFNAIKKLLNNSSYFYIICTDVDGNYSYVNKHYRDRFRHVEKDLVGKPFYVTIHPDDETVIKETAEKCFREPDKLFPATIRKHSLNNSYIITQWEFKMIRDNDVFKGFFCLGYDVTEFEQKKQELEKANEIIDSKSKAIDDIAFTQSHLVRSPLSNILGLVGILEKMELDENVRTIVDLLVESSKKLDGIIKEVVNKTNE